MKDYIDTDYETVYGYDIKELIVFAQMCKRQGITEKDLHDFCKNTKAIYDACWKEVMRIYKPTVEGLVNQINEMKEMDEHYNIAVENLIYGMNKKDHL